MAYTATAAVEYVIWNKFKVYLTSRLMNFRHPAYYAYIYNIYIYQPLPPSEYRDGIELRTIVIFLFTRLTRTDGSAFGLIHRWPGAGFAPVEWHWVVAHSGPLLLPFTAPGTAFGPLRPRRPASVHCENKYIYMYIIIILYTAVNESILAIRVRVSFAIIYMKSDRRYNIVYIIFHLF